MPNARVAYRAYTLHGVWLQMTFATNFIHIYTHIYIYIFIYKFSYEYINWFHNLHLLKTKWIESRDSTEAKKKWIIKLSLKRVANRCLDHSHYISYVYLSPLELAITLIS